jgi:hypothetical protein
MDDKVFTPEVIQENPFPQEPEVSALPSEKNPTGTFNPTTSKEPTFPKKRTAVELLSTVMNTRSRQILQEFELSQSGGIKIGDFKSGISGDVRLTPNGITARDIAGITTFAIDGTTGDAVFAGQVRAGSTIVSNTIVTEEATGGNGRTVYYNNGVPVIVIGDPD